MSVADPDLLRLIEEHDLRPTEVRDLFDVVRDQVVRDVALVVDERAAGVDPIPVLLADRLDLASDDERNAIRRRGCVVIRGGFEAAQAEAWNDQIGDYLERNRFGDVFAAHNPAEAAEGSGILGIYWSKPQVEARQHAGMRAIRHFLNSLWHHDADGTTWFDPDHDIGYADRIRRRAPGVAARGLRAHCDSVASGGWREPENQLVFANVLAGHPELHDPWDAAYRTTVEVSEAAPSGVFRTFQGWTALSEMQPSDGGLFFLPVPSAAAYLFVKGIAAELGVLGDDPYVMRRFASDDVLEPAAAAIPAMIPGDTVWWHGDLMHGVTPAANQSRWSNVMYVPSSPRCARNDAYATTMFDRFARGESPVDFPVEHFEAGFTGRATFDDLDPIGRQQFGLDRLPVP